MISVKKYSEENYESWNEFVENHEDGIFIFHRDYMDYHGSRISDYSFLIYRDENIIGIMPSHISGTTLFSHKGLSFGGLCFNNKLKTGSLKEVINKLGETIIEKGFNKITYTPIPLAYRLRSRYDDVYHFKKYGNGSVSQKMSFILNLRIPIRLSSNRKRILKKPSDLTLKISDDISDFISILKHLLKSKYDSSPVHTEQELQYLTSKFPHNIKLYAAYHQKKMVGGILIFIYGQVVKIQYIASDARGNEMNAVSFLLENIYTDFRQKKNYLDMGTAYNSDGSLNENLVLFKESFGAVGLTFDTLEVEL